MALDVGRAVSGADARGPHCERMRARALSSRAGHTESWRNFASNFLEALCCHPILGWLGSASSSRLGGVSANSSHGGTAKPASINTLWHWLTAMKHETGSPSSNCRIINLAVRGFLCLTIRKESAQLAQCAAARTRTALANPKPPADNDKVDNMRCR